MKELKTLKDLHLERADTRINDILKTEAVMWIKLFREIGDEKNKYAGNQFKQFFNLKEEDLK